MILRQTNFKIQINMFKFNLRGSLAGLLVACVALTGHVANSQGVEKKALRDIAETAIVVKGERHLFPANYRTLQIDPVAMEILLSSAPEESENARTASPVIFEMPMPDGTTSNFRIYKVEVMSAVLAAKFPEIKTYAGVKTDDPTSIIRLDITPLGFHAMILSPTGQIFIDPYSSNTTTDYICYNKKDIQRTSGFNCETADETSLRDLIPAGASVQKSVGTQLRTYRLALACTGEYAATKGGTVSGAMAGMVTSMNRVNGVYETEVAIRMVMVPNNNLIVYTNSSTDPYTNGNGSTMLGQNVTTCNNVIGSANYDIGHVFSTGGGGVAGLGVICGSSKARGVTGQTNPVGDPFDIDYVAHEIGHQFGGNHTFNSATSSCSGNRVASAAYEPGSGITIMAYAGICGSDNLASNSIAYFHTKSFDEIVNFSTTGGGNSCAVITSTGNGVPVVTSMGANYSIPVSTPFELTGAATDPNGHPLTYSWEQYNLGTAGAWNANLGNAPIFRPFSPTTSPSRTFPKLSDIINNTTTIGEILPNVARTMNFQFTVRDNQSAGGGVTHPDSTVSIAVINTGAAFAVTAPNTAVSWASGSSQTVTWNVSGTTASPISTANVKISLSTDGGNTFPTVILASTPNNGTQSITVPGLATTQARIKVEAVGNIYFDMSNSNFTITSSSFSSITTSSIATTNYCSGAALNVSFTTNGSANAGNIFIAQLSNSAGSFANPVSIGSLTATAGGTISCTIPAGTTSGSGYRIRVVSSNPVVNGSDNGANLTISGQVASAGSPQTAFTSYCANIPITVTVATITNATNYNWTVTNGGIITSGQGTTQITVVFPSGQPTTNSIISVFGSNANCTGATGSTTLTISTTPNTPTASAVSGCANIPINLLGSPAAVPGSTTASYSVSNPYTGSSNTYTYTLTTPFGCNATSAAANITVNPLPTVTAGNVSGCAGTSIALSGSPAGGSFSVPNPYTGPSTTYTYSYTNGNGCTNISAAANITVNPLPTVSFSGLTASYNVSAGTATLTGTPMGGVFSGIGISGNTFTPSVAGVGGPYTITYSYTDGNSCSNSSSQTTTVINCTVPSPPGSITSVGGTSKICPGVAKTYSVTNVATVTSYTWTPPVGATIITGQGTNQITVSYGAGFTATGPLTVYATNTCGNSAIRSLTITRNTPTTPGTMTGQTSGLCGLSAVPYSVVAVAGMTYNWSFSVANATIATGQGTNSVTADFLAGYVTGNIRVSASNACGTSALRSVTVKTTPAVPTSMTGSTTACANQFGVPYSISPIATATSYTWTVPSGAKINDGVVTSTTATLVTNATAVTVNFAATAGSVRVRAQNACGSSSYFTKVVTFNCRETGNNLQSFELNLFPIPANEILNISYESASESNFSIRLINMLGKEVFVNTGTSSSGNNQTEMNLEGITPGIYFLEVINGSDKKIEKVIIE